MYSHTRYIYGDFATLLIKRITMPRVTDVQTLADFKQAEGIKSLDLYRSKAGNLYAVVRGAALTCVCEPAKAGFVVTMVDPESGETWQFITDESPKPREVVATI